MRGYRQYIAKVNFQLTGALRTQLDQYARCVFYSEKLSWLIFTKTVHKLADQLRVSINQIIKIGF